MRTADQGHTLDEELGTPGAEASCRPATRIGRSEVELTKRRSGSRSTTIRLTYQSPSAVSNLADPTSSAGSSDLSFRVGRSITMSQVRSG